MSLAPGAVLHTPALTRWQTADGIHFALDAEGPSWVALDERGAAVLALFDGDVSELGAPTVAGASVVGEIVEQARGPKVIAFKKRRRKHSQRKRGHRQDLTVVRITGISAA